MNMLRTAFAWFALLLAGIAGAADYAPSAADTAEMQRLSAEYLGHLDRGEYEKAHAMFSDEMRAMAPLQEWRKFASESAAAWGALERRDQANVTWYLDPANAPPLGLYVAVDYASRYANLAQHTEFLVWYREREGMPFALARHEINAVDKKSAAKGASHPAAAPGRIPYPNVETARTALSARDDVRRSDVDGWETIAVPGENAIWSFTPATHPAHPSMVLRAPIERDGRIHPGIDVMCGATKSVCDAMVEEFKAMDARVAEQLQQAIAEGRKP